MSSARFSNSKSSNEVELEQIASEVSARMRATHSPTSSQGSLADQSPQLSHR